MNCFSMKEGSHIEYETMACYHGLTMEIEVSISIMWYIWDHYRIPVSSLLPFSSKCAVLALDSRLCIKTCLCVLVSVEILLSRLQMTTSVWPLGLFHMLCVIDVRSAIFYGHCHDPILDTRCLQIVGLWTVSLDSFGPDIQYHGSVISVSPHFCLFIFSHFPGKVNLNISLVNLLLVKTQD